jgi:quercetin dioxygenase-like cupin family protein
MQAEQHSTVPDQRWFAGALAAVHVDGAQVGGAYGVVEMTLPSGEMPPLHVHRHDDEAFLVQQGRLRLFLAGGTTIELGPGESAVAPRGVAHTYRVESDEPARVIVIGSPAGFERFVLDASDPAPAGELPPRDAHVDVARMAEAAGRAGIDLLGPPGALPEV